MTQFVNGLHFYRGMAFPSPPVSPALCRMLFDCLWAPVTKEGGNTKENGEEKWGIFDFQFLQAGYATALIALLSKTTA